MYNINGIPHNAVYVDTNVLSNICKIKGQLINFINKYPLSNHILTNSVFSLYELSKSDEVFEMYKNQFFCVPSVIATSGIDIMNKEIACYSNNSKVNIFSIVPVQIIIDGKKMQPETLHRLFQRKEFVNSFKQWDDNLPILFNDFTNLKSTLGYSPDENLNPKVDDFIRKCTLFLLEKYGHSFWKFMNKRKLEIDIHKFPSLKMMAYVSFYKFFSENRKPEINDIMDMIIASTVPYIEIFISEKNLINIIEKIKRKDEFIKDVKTQTISEFQKIES